MGYFVAAYFNWVLVVLMFGGISLRTKHMGGAAWIGVGVMLQVWAFVQHLYDWYRLEGRPDRLYVWIFPSFLVLISMGFFIFGMLQHLRHGNTQNAQMDL